MSIHMHFQAQKCFECNVSKSDGLLWQDLYIDLKCAEKDRGVMIILNTPVPYSASTNYP